MLLETKTRWLIKRYWKRFYLYLYKGHMRHYYISACYPHAIKRILLMIFGMFFIFTIVTAGIINIIVNRPASLDFSIILLALFLYSIVLDGIICTVLAIRGYRHRDKVGPAGYPSDFPRNSGNETWYVLFFSGTIIALSNYFDWW